MQKSTPKTLKSLHLCQKKVYFCAKFEYLTTESCTFIAVKLLRAEQF